MKNFSKFFLVAAASTMMFTSCSSDEPNGGQTPAEGDIYARLTLSLPQGSRSATTDPDDDGANSNSGHEVGNDSENNVGSVLVVIASKSTPTTTAGDDYIYIASNLADPHSATSTTPQRPTYNVQFETRDLYDHAGEEVYVFAYCNPTTKLVEAAKNGFEGGFVNATGDITEQTIWTKNGFLMSNAAITTVTLPTQPEMDEKYNSPTNPFNLGIVKVERASARFDFKQTTVSDQDEANLYPIYNHNNSDIDENGNVTNHPSTLMGYVKLDEMALINVAKSYYYLPRVSATGSGDNTADNPVSICGFETPNNYVVSPFYQQKIESSIELSFIRNHYLYNGQPATGTSIGFDFTSADLQYEALGTSLGEDNDQGWEGIPGYNIWKYTTENTIPQVDTQRKGITTGIAFKGHLVAADATSDLGKVITAAQNPIYAYNGVIYGDLAMLKAAVLANPVSTLAETFKAAYNIKAELTEELLAPLTDLTESNGFAIYRPVNGEYPMYYAYYNRHNDNGNNTVMGAMEFSVVRNNVYKIAVQNILEFGHPGKPGDDPDPEDPNDPDESPKTYFRVQVQVLPWVVRVNNIIL